ncbi:bifunctional glutamate N-acetyltransferase/amino-acid acetyltransferase ArgJ [Zymobacter palmae]|uniref:Arginine biosynthesis bifunctional protein ArgJ n=1 Tax=Zymobacter palmae TaxID=33074 RepID=A0A348HDI5_9GAMM|nr:bifunctional glutamate N-acetyltransferase/amino-acid acetyltransferase ArgJ [Zymobacter palmae]BBG29687.1 N-acetylglutamate synthase [Zymobacter palmae]
MATGSGAFPDMPSIAGIRAGIASAGIKKAGHRDLVVFELGERSQVAAVFTRNVFCAAPVKVARDHLMAGAPRYLLINTGNANAGTGEHGLVAANACCEALAHEAGVSAQQVLPYSTGVIGEPLPVERIGAALGAALADLASDHWQQAATGIMTTDTRPKGATRTLQINGQSVTINGIVKGSGMICPNMATMLVFIATDAAIEQAALAAMLRKGADLSFNRITVDSDTSTNDACTMVATGEGAVVAGDDLEAFATVLDDLMLELAQAVIRDGEGATKFVAIEVADAQSEEEALKIAYSVAHSPLVKTALSASDANWGRVLMAIGKAGVDLDVALTTLTINGVLIAQYGERAPGYSEEAGSRAMSEEDIVIRITLGRGDQAATVWTSDLSHEYVTINAEYRT